MPQLKRRKVFAAAIEATPGTPETLDAGDAAMNIYNAMIQPAIAFEAREAQGGQGNFSSVPTGHEGVATLRTYLEWDGTATEPLWADLFFPACGWVKSGQTYAPLLEDIGSNVKTLTLASYVDGVRKMLAGCMGSFVVTLPTGAPAYIDWTFRGVWQAVTDVALLTPTYPTAKPLRFARGLAELNNVNLCIESATIDSGNTVIMRECPITEAGFITALVTNRLPTGTINPESVLVATQDRWGAFLAGTEWALELDVGGPTNSQIEFNVAKAQILNMPEGEREGLVVDDIEFQANKNGSTANEELLITFTAAT